MFGDLGKLMKLAGELKKKMPEVRAKLDAGEHTAQAGGAAVSATVNGKMMLIDLKIDPSVLKDGQMDGEMLADLVKAAVSAAQEKAAAAAQDAMKELTGGMELPPGLGF